MIHTVQIRLQKKIVNMLVRHVIFSASHLLHLFMSDDWRLHIHADLSSYVKGRRLHPLELAEKNIHLCYSVLLQQVLTQYLHCESRLKQAWLSYRMW
jgi:hypothetical protein